jgi:large subunit ribosomal protein L35
MKQKQKTHSGAKDRFKLTKNGKLKRRSAFSSHMFINKSEDQKRGTRSDRNVADGDKKNVMRMLGLK